MPEQTLTTKLDEAIDLRSNDLMPHLAYLPNKSQAATAKLLDKLLLPHITMMQSVKAEDSTGRRFADRVGFDMFKGVPVMAEKSIQAFGDAVASMYAKVWHFGEQHILLRAMLSMWTGRTVTQTFGKPIRYAIEGVCTWLQSGYWGDNVKRYANRFLPGWGTDRPSSPPSEGTAAVGKKAEMGGE